MSLWTEWIVWRGGSSETTALVLRAVLNFRFSISAGSGKWLCSFMIVTLSWKVRTRPLHLVKTHRHEIEVSVRIRCLKYAYASWTSICHENFHCQHELESNNNEIVISRVYVWQHYQSSNNCVGMCKWFESCVNFVSNLLREVISGLSAQLRGFIDLILPIESLSN